MAPLKVFAGEYSDTLSCHSLFFAEALGAPRKCRGVRVQGPFRAWLCVSNRQQSRTNLRASGSSRRPRRRANLRFGVWWFGFALGFWLVREDAGDPLPSAPPTPHVLWKEGKREASPPQTHPTRRQGRRTCPNTKPKTQNPKP